MRINSPTALMNQQDVTEPYPRNGDTLVYNGTVWRNVPVDAMLGAGTPCFCPPLTLFKNANSSLDDGTTWQTQDVSAFVPVGAVAAYLNLQQFISPANNSTYLTVRAVGHRAGGNDQDGSLLQLFSPVGAYYFMACVWVPLSPSRTFEYRRVNTGNTAGRYWVIDLLGWN